MKFSLRTLLLLACLVASASSLAMLWSPRPYGDLLAIAGVARTDRGVAVWSCVSSKVPPPSYLFGMLHEFADGEISPSRQECDIPLHFGRHQTPANSTGLFWSTPDGETLLMARQGFQWLRASRMPSGEFHFWVKNSAVNVDYLTVSGDGKRVAASGDSINEHGIKFTFQDTTKNAGQWNKLPRIDVQHRENWSAMAWRGDSVWIATETDHHRADFDSYGKPFLAVTTPIRSSPEIEEIRSLRGILAAERAQAFCQKVGAYRGVEQGSAFEVPLVAEFGPYCVEASDAKSLAFFGPDGAAALDLATNQLTTMPAQPDELLYLRRDNRPGQFLGVTAAHRILHWDVASNQVTEIGDLSYELNEARWYTTQFRLSYGAAIFFLFAVTASWFADRRGAQAEETVSESPGASQPVP